MLSIMCSSIHGRSGRTEWVVFLILSASVVINCKTDVTTPLTLSSNTSAMATNDVTYKELVQLMDKEDVFIIDVREESEIKETGELPKSINIPLGDLKSAFDLPADTFRTKYDVEKPRFDSPLVFTCRSGRRSQIAVDQVREFGYPNVRNFEGGFLNWEKNQKAET